MRALKNITRFSILAGLLITFQGFPQDGGVAETSLSLKTIKKNQDNRSLEARLVMIDTNGRRAMAGSNVEFYIQKEDLRDKIGDAITDQNGWARLNLSETRNLWKNEEGYQLFIATYPGSESRLPAEAEVMVKDAWLRVEFFFEDSVKFIRYAGFSYDLDGSVLPMADQDIYLFVPRMFSLMPIADGWLESDGTGIVEFPSTLIGDEHGNIEVIAAIEDHPEFGNLEARASIDWAIPKHSERAEGPMRELWTPIAPTWMIVTLIILLAGVWLHYFYAIWELYRIKQASKHLD